MVLKDGTKGWDILSSVPIGPISHVEHKSPSPSYMLVGVPWTECSRGYG